MKDYRKFTVYSEFRGECCKESKDEDCAFICYKFVWQSIVVNDLSDDDICEIFYEMGFVGRREFAIFSKTIHCNEDIIIAGIIDRVPRFK